jgi:hypothetical protein
MHDLRRGTVGLKEQTKSRAACARRHNDRREQVMKKLRIGKGIAIASAIVLGLTLSAQSQTWLLDFGGGGTFRDIATPSPDSNGNYWNNINYAYLPGMVDITGAVTSMAYGPDGAYGTDSYNGPAGDTSTHPATIGNTVFNPGALGNLGQTNAVYDYFDNIHFQLQGLDPTKQYKLTFFGSHKYNADNTTIYSLHSDATYGAALASTSLLVGVDDAHNQDTVAVINNVSPQLDTIMYISATAAAGVGYLNAMQLEVVPEPATVTLVGLALLGVIALRRRHTS